MWFVFAMVETADARSHRGDPPVFCGRQAIRAGAQRTERWLRVAPPTFEAGAVESAAERASLGSLQRMYEADDQADLSATANDSR
jgi:hypothetical protein